MPQSFSYSLASKPDSGAGCWITIGLMMMMMISLDDPKLFSQSTAPQATSREDNREGREEERQEGRQEGRGETIESLATRFIPSLVEIGRADRSPLLGMVVSADGKIITKFSELDQPIENGPIRCQLPNAEWVNGKLVRYDQQLDLALIQLSVAGLKPIDFPATEHGDPIRAGNLVISVTKASGEFQTGIVSTEPSDLGITQPPPSIIFDLGIQTSGERETEFFQIDQSVQHRSGVRVTRVLPRMPGESLGLLVGDLIYGINDKIDLTPEIFQEQLAGMAINQKLLLKICRNRKGMELQGTATRPIPLTEHDRWGGGPFSARRFDFGPVIIHDTQLNPDSCGGPLIDLDGKIIGINIARSLRVASVAVPIERVRLFVFPEER